MFTIKGKLKRREYYQLYFWENKSNFYVTILLTFLVSVVSFNHISIAQTILGGDWILVRIDWIKLLIFGLVFMFVIMMTDAGIRKKVLLKDKEYIFSDEKITIQTSKSETYILWNKVTKIKETKP